MPRLYLIPTLIGPDALAEQVLPQGVLEIVRSTKHWAVETPKVARAFLKACGVLAPYDDHNFHVVDKRVKREELDAILKSTDGADLALLSDAGSPGIADAGGPLIRYAHEKGWIVTPLVGPSAVMLAIGASGFNPNRFVFHGYIPADRIERINTLKRMEEMASRSGAPQYFIETPYRNEPLMADLVNVLQGPTLLSIAAGITWEQGWVKTQSVIKWKSTELMLKGIPCVYGIGGGPVARKK